jgi:nitrite reductase/ring-hydroxylating ferredoxin subunit
MALATRPRRGVLAAAGIARAAAPGVRGGRYGRAVDSTTAPDHDAMARGPADDRSITARLDALGVQLAGEPPGPAARPAVADALRRARPGDVVAAQHRGHRVAVAVLADGRAFAVADRCPHDGGLLSDGFVDGDRLVCARHGWELDPCTGRCPQRPGETIAVRPLRRR